MKVCAPSTHRGALLLTMRAVDNDLWLCDHLLLEAHVDAQVLLTPEIGLIYEFDG